MTNESTNQLVSLLEGVIATLKRVDDLEAQIALTNGQLRAMQETNNQLADIAFDENKFTQALLDKVEEVAIGVAKTEVQDIDIDEIARETAQYVDIVDEVQRHVERLGCVTTDDMGDIIEDRIDSYNYQTESDVESAISDYLESNDYVQRDDVEDVVRDAVNDVVDERTENVARRIVKEEITALLHKLIKENDHANNGRDTSIHISGTDTGSQGVSYNAAGT